MSHFCLIEAVEAEGLGGGGVVAAAFGDVQVTGVFDSRDDGGADGGQIDGPAAGPAGGSVLAERRVPYMVMCLDGPVLADQAGQIRRGGVRAGQAGDGVDSLAGGPAGAGVLPPAGDLDGLAGVREVQAADMSGLQGAGLDAAVPGFAGRTSGRYLPPGQGPDPGVQQRLVLLRHRDVMGLFSVASQSRFARTVYRASKVTTAPARSRSAWPARLIHCPTAVNRSFPAAVNAQTATAIRQASG